MENIKVYYHLNAFIMVKLVILTLNVLLKEITPMKRKEKARINLAILKSLLKGIVFIQRRIEAGLMKKNMSQI